ncbi:hypothetical protein NDU88_006614 [Pleurodeles waltl]|uniref:Secreted protein n=1 Tax=Pleurodeles waltl TaxID=8319 RepID=A0AAV7X159_PLEWA|nr:hypothetical protein NDU88_006614 [Pleurodeles waltl]
MAPAAHRPCRQLSSPPFGLVLLSSGAFTVQGWVEGSPPRVQQRTAALWPRIAGGTRRLVTAPQLGLCFVFVSSHYRAPAVLVRSWCRTQSLRSPRAPGLHASLVFSTTSAPSLGV